MTEDQMRAKSGEKVKQLQDLAKVLQVSIEAKQRLNAQNGLIELVVQFMDMEQYPKDEVPAAVSKSARPARPAAKKGGKK